VAVEFVDDLAGRHGHGIWLAIESMKKMDAWGSLKT